jgi:hypothetical protein
MSAPFQGVGLVEHGIFQLALTQPVSRVQIGATEGGSKCADG